MAYETVNPYTNELVKSYPYASEAEIDAAIEKSHEAFLRWRTTGFGDRSKVLTRAAELLRAEKRTFADVLTLEMGKITAEAEVEVELCAEILDYFADHGPGFLEDEPLPVKDAKEGTVTIVFEPLGVLYAIEPWNFPYYQVVRVGAPQILAGNTIVLKHAANVPASALAMQKLFDDAGLTASAPAAPTPSWTTSPWPSSTMQPSKTPCWRPNAHDPYLPPPGRRRPRPRRRPRAPRPPERGGRP